MIYSNKSKTRIGGHNKYSAFTLAEVLITIVIIGVIAAITIPAMLPAIQERVDSHRHANIVLKVTQAMNSMRALGLLYKYDTPDDFVDELQKHLKIAKRCSYSNIEDCWPTKTVTTAKGETYEVKNCQKASDLGVMASEWKNLNNVGIILADGASIILTYDPTFEIAPADENPSIGKYLPVGGGRSELLEFTNQSTAGLKFVVDVNGDKKPNSETIGTRMHDIRSLNGANFAGCGGIINGVCYTMLDSYASLDCSHTPSSDYSKATLNVPENADYCNSISKRNPDYWAGAVKACRDMGASLPNSSQMKSTVCPVAQAQMGLNSGKFWSSSLDTAASSIYFDFSDSTCSVKYIGRQNTFKAICVK